MLEAVHHRRPSVHAVVVPLAHAGDQEHLVVHSQPEHNTNQYDRKLADQGLRIRDQSGETLLPDQHRNAKCCCH